MNTPAPWQAAIQAHHEVLAFLHGSLSKEYIKAWEADRYEKYGLSQAQPSAAAGRFLLPDTYQADPIYISPDMQQLVYAAMDGFDPTEECIEEDFFIKNGFAYLPEPFYSIANDGKKLAWRAISWNLTHMWTLDMGQQVLADKIHQTGRTDFTEDELKEAGITPDQELVLRVCLWAHLDDVDDFPMPPDVAATIKIMNTPWLISHMTAIPMAAVPEIRETRGEGDMAAAWLVFLRVLNKVMAEKVIVKDRQRPPRPFRRYAEKKNWPVKDVTVIELRRRTTKDDEAGHSGRQYSHQWIVQGFWRNQWYPSLKKHRRKYIVEHVAGPKDKPLITKGRVWNLDR